MATRSRGKRVPQQIEKLRGEKCQPDQIGHQLDKLAAQLGELPAIHNYTDTVDMLIVELKSDALKERHWTQLMQRLGVNWVLSDLNLGQVWDMILQSSWINWHLFWINGLFDVWIDVQRRWVYLEGIFSGSADIETSQADETARFQSISSGFLTLMKKVSESPKVIDVLNIPGVQKTLERFADLLASSLNEAVQNNKLNSRQRFMNWCDNHPTQIVVLAAQVEWTKNVEAALAKPQHLKKVLSHVENTLNVLADSVLQEQPELRRKKLEHLINEFVHKRTVTRKLVSSGVCSNKTFEWLCQMRFYFDPLQTEVLKQLTIHMANARFYYGFEYLGVQDRLVQTPLTDRCYLTMTQTLEARLGGSPFGPAGTGKTESVKALGNQLGRFVLVFNCDETFDFHRRACRLDAAERGGRRGPAHPGGANQVDN